MDLFEFVESMKEEIDEFAKLYQLNGGTFPEDYPIEMNEGEWFEQLLAHMT